VSEAARRSMAAGGLGHMELVMVERAAAAAAAVVAVDVVAAAVWEV
jgi:hypothetical protein